MSIKQELEMAKEYLTKRLSNIEGMLNVNLGAECYDTGNEHLREKIIHIEEAILLIEGIIPKESQNER